jgi:hypothetical protein
MIFTHTCLRGIIEWVTSARASVTPDDDDRTSVFVADG